MRFFLWCLLLGGLSMGGWTWWSEAQHAADREERRVADVREQIGVRRMLIGHAALSFSNVVVGTADADDLRDFRARLNREGRLRPVFGQARRLCLKGQDTADCWAITYLEVDGTPVEVGAVAVVQTPGPFDVPAIPAAAEARPDDGPVLLETADIPALRDPVSVAQDIDRPDSAQTTSATSREVKTSSLTKSPESSRMIDPTHRVARARINARSGPGTKNPIVMKLTAGAPLGILARKNGWGHFIVLQGDRKGTEIWVSLNIVEPIRSSRER